MNAQPRIPSPPKSDNGPSIGVPGAEALPTRYEIIRLLGEGGQGAVYEARDRLRAGSRVALKVLSLRSAAGLEADAIRKEFLILSRLAHPAVARVQDFGFLDKGLGVYFTTEFIEGQDLLSWLASGTPSEQDLNSTVRDLLAQSLSALHAVHGSGFSHGDVKPANLLITACPGVAQKGARAWQAKVIDLGGAKLLTGEGRTGWVTPVYQSPVALRGNGIAEDLFALGLTFFHAIVGRLPFDITDAAAAEAWRESGKAARVAEFSASVSDRTSKLIESLTTSGRGRFSSASDALRQLRGQRKTPLRVFTGHDVGETAGRLHGRSDDLQKLTSDLQSGASPVILLTAPPGMGKSRVVEALVAELQIEGWKTTIARAGADETAIGDLLAFAGDVSARSVLGHSRVSDRATALVASLQNHRVLLVLEDWSPARSGSGVQGELLQCLVNVLCDPLAAKTTSPLEILITGTDRESILAEHSTRTLPMVHKLERLKPAAIHALVADHFHTDQFPPELGEVLTRLTHGHPDRVQHALIALAREGVELDELGFLVLPSNWQKVLEGAVSDFMAVGDSIRLSTVERDALSFLAALERLSVSAAESARLSSGLGLALEDDVEGWARVLQRFSWQGYVNAISGKGDTRYRLAVDAPVSSALTEESRELACRVVEIYRKGGPDLSERDADDLTALTRSALRAGELLWARSVGRLAARLLRRRGRQREAIMLMELLLDPGVAIDARNTRLLVARHAQLCQLLGDAERGLATLEKYSDDLPSHLSLRGMFCEALGKAEDAAEAYEKIVGDLDVSSQNGAALPSRSALWYHAQTRLTHLRVKSGDIEAGQKALQTGAELLEWARERCSSSQEAPPPNDYINALSGFGIQHSIHGDVETARSFLTSAIDLARAAKRDDLEESALGELAILSARSSRFDGAETAFLRCQELAESRRDRLTSLKILVNRAALRYRAGRVDEAESLYRQARGVSDGLGPNPCSPVILLGLEVIAHDRGDLLTALSLLRALLRQEARLEPSSVVRTYFNLGEIYLRLGAGRKALAARRRALEFASARQNNLDSCLGHTGVAAILWALGELDEAQEHLDLAESCAEDQSSEGPLRARASYFRAHIALGRGEARVAYEKFRSAARHCRDHRYWAYYELALLGMVESLLRCGERRRALRLIGFVNRVFGTDSHAPSRVPHRPIYPALHESFALVCGTDPDRAETILSLARERRQSGDTWEAIQVASVGRYLSGPGVSALLALAEESVGHLTRGLSPRTVIRARDLHVGARVLDSDVSSKGSEVTSGTTDEPRDVAELFLQWSGMLPEAVRDPVGLQEELERLRQSLKVDALWILNDPDRQGSLTFAARSNVDATLPAFSSLRDELDQCRRDRRPRRGDRWCLVPIPTTELTGGRRLSLPRVFHAIWQGDGPRSDALFGAASACGFLLRLLEQDETLRDHRARLEEQAVELRALHSRLAREKSQLDTAVLSQRQELVSLRQGLGGGGQSSENLSEYLPVAESKVMKEVLHQLQVLAPTDLPVLFTGEPGTGKDFLARLLHSLSPRREFPMLSQVCEIPESLLESEMFGAARGAFTGADEDRAGLLKICDGGSIYLDRIEDMPAGVQGRMLRFLEDGVIRPLGGEVPVAVNVRLVSSSCLSLAELGRDERLRTDLLYRLQAAVVEIPPLRARREDIGSLFHYLLKRHCGELELPLPNIESGVEELLVSHDWPGNIRELDAMVRRALVNDPRSLDRESFGLPAESWAPLNSVSESSVQATESPPETPLSTLQEARQELELELLKRALREASGNATTAAKLLDVSRRYLGTLLARYELSPMDFRPKSTDEPGSSGDTPSS